MESEISYNQIIKIAIGVAALIIVIILISLFTSKEDNKIVEVQSIMLETKNVSLLKGNSYQLKVNIAPINANNKTVTYLSNNNYVATVSESGYVRAINPGEAKISVISANGKQDQCLVVVEDEKIPVSSISLEYEDLVLTEGESITLNTKVEPSNTTDHNYIWTSDNASVASVVDGVVTGIKAGEALIMVKTENNKVAICNVEVREKVTGIKLDIDEKTVAIGNTLNIKATLEPAGTTAKINWTSSNPSVADVSNGTVTGKEVGETTITAESNGKKATAKIKVKVVTTSDIYTFKYNNNKPTIKCNSYTSSDKIRLEDQLKRAIERVGYGTRAGVVEAARFFVGGLDYKIPYQGTVKGYTDVGRYNREGLNLGTSSGWGCKIPGTSEQGIDCTNFVRWAFINGGHGNKSPMSSSNTYKTAEVVSQIRPGDLMYSPCTSKEGKCASQDYTHVGIVIGVDETKIYVAESRSESSSDGTVVTEWQKNNMPKTGKFSIVRLVPYAGDGKLTDMWD